jgi:hypothetical protein
MPASLPYLVIIRNAGLDQEFFTRTEYDAYTLFNALTRTFMRVELWHGDEQKALYDSDMRAILA